MKIINLFANKGEAEELLQEYNKLRNQELSHSGDCKSVYSNRLYQIQKIILSKIEIIP